MGASGMGASNAVPHAAAIGAAQICLPMPPAPAELEHGRFALGKVGLQKYPGRVHEFT
jgi:hypothetical protein